MNYSGIKSREYAVSYRLYPLLLNLAFDDETHNQDEDEGADFERKQAIWMLKEKRKLIRAIAKTINGEIKSMETTSDTTNQQLPDRLRNNSS